MFGKRGASAPDSSLPGRRRADAASGRERAATEDLSNRYAFRRNRTLTGSSSARITSSNELNAELRSPRAHVHHLTSLRRRLLTYFIGVATASFGLYVLVSQLVATTNISIDAAPSAVSSDTQAYNAAFESYYGARPVERFRFLLDRPALLSHVQSSRPEVGSLRIEPGAAPGEASVIVNTRKPIARWSINGTNQYVDRDGVVFTKNYHDEPHLQIIDDSGLDAASSELIASDRFLGFIGLVVAKSATYGLDIDTITIPALTTRQVVISLAGQGGTQYKLSVDRSPGEQVEDIARITKYLSANSLKPGYVDVRIAGKAYYR